LWGDMGPGFGTLIWDPDMGFDILTFGHLDISRLTLLAWPADLAGRLGRQTSDLAIRLGRQTWPADLAGRLGRQT
jgi:hypothetical protein